MVLKFIKEHQVLIAAVLIAVMLYLMYHRKPQVIQDAAGIIAAKNETIKVLQQSREIEREMFNERIAMYERSDSLLRLKDKVQTVRYEKIPIIVSGLSRDSLRAEVIRFTN